MNQKLLLRIEKEKTFTIQKDGSLREDIDAISVFDYLHTDENDEFYRKNNAEFASVVDNVLRRQTFNIAIKRVLTANDNTSLRLKNINHEMSPKFREFTNSRPVVLGHGLFENLFSMEELGIRIATYESESKKYRDAWLIEMTGGPNTECNNCPNYNMGDLVDYYWPALIGGVLAYTNEDDVDYVGYDLGGGVGIRSYEKYYGGGTDVGWFVNDDGEWEGFDLPADFVDHMALIAPIGAYNGDTAFVRCLDNYGNSVNNNIEKFKHISSEEIGKWLTVASMTQLSLVGDIEIPFFKIAPTPDMECASFGGFMFFGMAGNYNISSNLWINIIEDVQNKTNSNLSLTSIDELFIIRTDDSEVIPYEDLQYIYNNSNANEKYSAEIYWPHKDLPHNQVSYRLLSKFLNDEQFDVWDYMWNIDI